MDKLSYSDPNCSILPLFIFDGESAGTKLCGYNRFTYLLECLKDLDEEFKKAGSRLFIARYVIHLSQL